MEGLDEHERELLMILDALGAQLEPFDHETIRKFLAFGEPVLAFEALCTQICERGARPCASALAAILRIARLWGIDASYTSSLKPALPTEPE